MMLAIVIGMLTSLIIQLMNIMLTEIHFRIFYFTLIYVPEETSLGDLFAAGVFFPDENNIPSFFPSVED